MASRIGLNTRDNRVKQKTGLFSKYLNEYTEGLIPGENRTPGTGAPIKQRSIIDTNNLFPTMPFLRRKNPYNGYNFKRIRNDKPQPEEPKPKKTVKIKEPEPEPEEYYESDEYYEPEEYIEYEPNPEYKPKPETIKDTLSRYGDNERYQEINDIDLQEELLKATINYFIKNYKICECSNKNDINIYLEEVNEGISFSSSTSNTLNNDLNYCTDNNKILIVNVKIFLNNEFNHNNILFIQSNKDKINVNILEPNSKYIYYGVIKDYIQEIIQSYTNKSVNTLHSVEQTNGIIQSYKANRVGFYFIYILYLVETWLQCLDESPDCNLGNIYDFVNSYSPEEINKDMGNYLQSMIDELKNNNIETKNYNVIYEKASNNSNTEWNSNDISNIKDKEIMIKISKLNKIYNKPIIYFKNENINIKINIIIIKNKDEYKLKFVKYKDDKIIKKGKSELYNKISLYKNTIKIYKPIGKNLKIKDYFNNELFDSIHYRPNSISSIYYN